MSTLTRAAVYTVRIAAVTAATPVLAGAAAASATAKLAGWELRQLTSSPLSAQARRLTANTMSWPRPTAPAQPRQHGSRGTPGDGRDKHRPNSMPARSGQARAQLAALNPSR
jgi:hypothetical protein